MRAHHVSFKHAFNGIWYNLTTQPNFRFHLFATILVITAGLYFHLNPTEWLILAFTIVLVICAEMINTALEAVTDLVTTRRTFLAKIAKDTSAGMVLLTAFGAVVVAGVIFLPKVFAIKN